MTYEENIKKFDVVRPGEQWFLYWNTSAALWETRIQEIPQNEIVFIPIYWGLHGVSLSEWDFGSTRPECDLLRLVHLLTRYGRSFCWIIPLTPSPFLPNGGVPTFAARSLSISYDGVHLAVFDQEMNFNKMYSYFEPKVFQSFSQFLKGFGHFLSTNQIHAPVWGSEFYFYHNGRRYSFLEDHSISFDQGFSRFLKKNNPLGVELSDQLHEFSLKENFQNEVALLFEATAETALAPFWKGSQKITCLGSSPEETIQRSLAGGKSQLDYTKDLFEHYVNSEWISSVLLTPVEKKGLLTSILKEHYGTFAIEKRYNLSPFKKNMSNEFSPYGVIDIFGGRRELINNKIGLTSYLDKFFPWLYQIQERVDFTSEWIDSNQHKIKIFQGKELDRTTFAQILKLFLMGQKVLINRSEMGEGFEKKIQIFLIENNIKVQNVNFMTFTQVCELGEGRLILFEANKLIENNHKEKYWDHIFQYLHLTQPEIKMDQDVFTLWRIRATSEDELSYLDVRRLNIYNPTSYKKSVKIKTHKHFALMKMIDPNRANAKSTPEGVDIEILPQGKIALDFGHYEES